MCITLDKIIELDNSGLLDFFEDHEKKLLRLTQINYNLKQTTTIHVLGVSIRGKYYVTQQDVSELLLLAIKDFDKLHEFLDSRRMENKEEWFHWFTCYVIEELWTRIKK